MGEKLRNLLRLPGLDFRVKRLNDHLAKALAGAHDVGRVHGLVCGNQHKPAASVGHGGVSRLVGADGVVLDGFAGAVLHQGHVLVGRRVINDLRPVFLKHLEHPPAVPHRSDQHRQLQLRIFFLQLQLNRIGAVFIYVEDDQAFRPVGRNLAAKLRSDGSAAAGHQNGFPGNEFENLLQVRADRVAAQQVLHGNFPDRGHGNLAGHQLVNPGQLLQLAVGFAADRQDVPLCLNGHAGDRQDDFIHLVFRRRGQDVVPPADDRHALHIPVPFVRVVVDDAYNLVGQFPGGHDLPQNGLPGVARADDHHALPALFHGLPVILQQLDQPEPEPGDAKKDKLEEGAPYIIGNRHPDENHRDQQRVQQRRDHRPHEGPNQLGIAGKPPHAVVHFEEKENDDAVQRPGEDEPGIGFDERLGDGGIGRVVAQIERKKISEANGHEVIHRQHNGNNLPVLDHMASDLQGFPALPARSPRLLHGKDLTLFYI